jgi:hypothetical protein
MHRIYFDENEGDEHGNFDLGLPGSLVDIEAAGKDLSDGLHVIPYDNEEIEVEAVIKWDSQHRRWMAAPIWDTLKYTSES